MLSSAEHREQLLFKVQGDAFYRHQRAAEFPDDARNAHAAAAADRIAAYLESLTADDWRFERIAQLNQLADYASVTIDGSADEPWRASRIGFQGGPPADPSAWLDHYLLHLAGEVRGVFARHSDECQAVGDDECASVTGEWNQPSSDWVGEARELLDVLQLDDVSWCRVRQVAWVMSEAEDLQAGASHG